ncbi:hypothetical protein LSCM1_01840 [Leishmania martiniquensis]|uniref:Uncharacterized protein n=1 Tax=Leishmania martiniquensis TaxID=1580590 RepID=A0A836GRQ4_9TRYP|nr:hypothetical protein LSCM1_01840 [Leishmania martiniquensis]
MALITQSFSERYAELVSRVPTYTEMLLDVQRREFGERKALEEKCQMAFRDVLHVAAVMISDKKSLGKSALAHRNRFELALYQRQTAVWFPATPPRQVALPTGRQLRAFPHAAFAELCKEERELRQWLYGVERRLREHIEEACGRAWFFLNLIGETVARESLSRQRVQYEEDQDFNAVKQAFFRAVPADYYRLAVIARYGRTVSAVETAKDLSVEEMEEAARAVLNEEEETSRRSVFQYLHDMYDFQLFALNHREVTGRYEIEDEECNALFPLVAQCCREDFGIIFYHVPALALHFSSSYPCLRALCLAQLQEAPRRTAATKARFSWVPAQLLASLAGKVEIGGEESAVGSQGDADSDESPENAPPALDEEVGAATTSTTAPEAELSSSEVPEPMMEEEAVAPPPPPADDTCLRVLYAFEETEAHSPAADECVEAEALPEDVSAFRSDSNPEAMPTPQSPPRCLLVDEELAMSNPRLTSLRDEKRPKRPSKSKEAVEFEG